LTDPEEKGKKETTLVKDVEALIGKYAGTFAAQRAYAVRANIAFENKDWDKAAETWIELARKAPKSYIAPIALMNAAAALEEKGDPAKSLEILESLTKGYSTAFPEMPRVLFSIGRLSEAKESFETASTNYNKIIDEYPSSSWTKLARNRIIYLKTQNKIPN
jgi:TolA-binding protein